MPEPHQLPKLAHVPRRDPRLREPSEPKEIGQVLIADATGKVMEQWTGPQVAWTMARGYPGDPGTRQPVHTVYVPADRFVAQGGPDLPAAWGAEATAALARHAPRADDLAHACGLDVEEVRAVWGAVVAKLEREPVEDLRVDLEDGYGTRTDDEEDADARTAGRALGAAAAAGTCPPFVGVRFKSLEGSTRRRGLRSLDLVLDALPLIVELGGQLALVGEGDSWFEDSFRAAAERHPGAVGAVIGKALAPCDGVGEIPILVALQ